MVNEVLVAERKPGKAPKAKTAGLDAKPNGPLVKKVVVKRAQNRLSASTRKRRSAGAKHVIVKTLSADDRAIRPLVYNVTGVSDNKRSDLIKAVVRGVEFRAIAELQEALGLTRTALLELINIASTTLSRRKTEGRLKPDESDRIVRFAQLKDAALAMMQGDNNAALHWLKTPLGILGAETPLEHARTEMGSRDVEDLIGRIRHGVYS